MGKYTKRCRKCHKQMPKNLVGCWYCGTIFSVKFLKMAEKYKEQQRLNKERKKKKNRKRR